MTTTPRPAIGLSERLRGLNRCIRCDCQSCRSGFENHEHICTTGPGCVKPLEKRLREAVRIAGEAATQLDAQAADIQTKEQAIADMARTIDARAARVKELEAGWHDCITELTAEKKRVKELEDESAGFMMTGILYKNATADAEARALRAEQQRDEAYARAANVCDAYATRLRVEAHQLPEGDRERSNLIAAAVEVRIVEKAIRRLAAGDEEGN